MGKKGKVGKSRKDRFYHLAKETGYRARSAFKLIQLNRKFEFLQKSNVIIDLCAAPGGWLQVAAENAPMSNHIIGIDLDPINPIKNVKTLQEDITTEKCRQALKKELHTIKADLVLNDGAPNVGKNWLNDAYLQAELSLHALKLSTEFLRKGGWFVTKLFRSKDYDSMMWIFQQLFKNVHATKPQASRNESAEIFVVCQNYIAPDKIDPKFLNPKFAFKEVKDDKIPAIDLIHPSKKRRQREGYPEGDYTLFYSTPATEFLDSTDYMTLLAQSSEIKLNSAKIENHPFTTTEIKECLKDIKLLGKKDLKSIFTWRKKLKKAFEDEGNAEIDKESKDDAVVTVEKEGEDGDEALAEDERDLADLEKLLEEKNLQELRTMKKAKKKVKKAQMKQKTRIDLKMAIPGDKIDIEGDVSVFNITRIKNKKQLSEIEQGDMSHMDGEDAFEDDDDDDVPKQKTAVFDRAEKKYVGFGEDSEEEEEMEEEPSFDNDDDDDMEEDQSDDEKDENTNPLLLDLGLKDRMMKDKEDSWFSKSVFADLEKDRDEDIELEQMGMMDYGDDKVPKSRKGKKKQKDDAALLVDMNGDGSESDDDDDESEDDDNESEDSDAKDTQSKADVDSGVGDADSEDDSDDEDDDSSENSDYDYMEANSLKKKNSKSVSSATENTRGGKKTTKFDGIEVVPATFDPNLQLNAEGLALGTAMVQSRKRRREIIESGYHRFMYDDDDLPDWFVKDEKKHIIRQMPITKEEVEEQRLKSKAIDAQPIKKIAEAKARKKKRVLKSLEKARKKANTISDNVDVSEKEKWNQIKHVYKKAGLLNKTKAKVTYVVSKKGAGKKVRRPAGVQGKFKVVDGRMKKDLRGEKKADARKQKSGKKSGKRQGNTKRSARR